MNKRGIGSRLSLLAALGALAGLPAPASAAESGSVTVEASIDGIELDRSTETQPLRLSPSRQSLIEVDVTNGGSIPLQVRTVRLEGNVFGLDFFTYDTSVGLVVAPGETGSRRFLLDLGGLDGQATGLIRGSVQLLGREREELGGEGGVFDVRGSLRSVYGLFGLSAAILTLLTFLGTLVGLARHTLPPNRWRRALRFMTPGIGLGLVINFSLSAFRTYVPELGRWLAIMVASGLVLFGIGYLSPRPDDEEEEDELDVIGYEPAPAALPRGPRRQALGRHSIRRHSIRGLPHRPKPVLPAPPDAPEVAADPATPDS